LVSEKIAASDT